MDAYDWCLSCEKYLQGNEGPYCSDACRSRTQAPPIHTSSAPVTPSHPTPHYPSFAHRRSLQQPLTPSSSCYDSAHSEVLSVSQYYQPAKEVESAMAWVGKGVEGIYDWARQVHPGPPPHANVQLMDGASTSYGASGEVDPLRPSLLVRQAPRVPVPPKVFGTSNSGKTQPAPPVPSRPILAAQTSMPSLTAHSATASLSSLATPGSLTQASRLSSARASMHIPSKPASVAGDEDDEQGPPSAETQKPTFLANIAERIKTWAAGEHSAIVNHPPYSPAHQIDRRLVRSTTTTTPADAPLRAQRSPTALTVKGVPPRGPQMAAPATVRVSTQGKVHPPVSFFPLDSDLLAELEEDAMSSGPLRATVRPRALREQPQDYNEKSQHTRDDHPAFLARGRRAERAVW